MSTALIQYGLLGGWAALLAALAAAACKREARRAARLKSDHAALTAQAPEEGG